MRKAKCAIVEHWSNIEEKCCLRHSKRGRQLRGKSAPVWSLTFLPWEWSALISFAVSLAHIWHYTNNDNGRNDTGKSFFDLVLMGSTCGKLQEQKARPNDTLRKEMKIDKLWIKFLRKKWHVRRDVSLKYMPNYIHCNILRRPSVGF